MDVAASLVLLEMYSLQITRQTFAEENLVKPGMLMGMLAQSMSQFLSIC